MRSSVSLRLALASFFSDTAEYNILLPTAPRLTANESELTRATLLCMFRKMSSAMEERRGGNDVILAANGEWLLLGHSQAVSTLQQAALMAYTQSYFIYAACLLQTYAWCKYWLSLVVCHVESHKKKKKLTLISTEANPSLKFCQRNSR